MARHMDQMDMRKRHARRSDAIPRMLVSFLSCAHQQTTSILSHYYGCCTPLERAAVFASFAIPGTHMLAYLRVGCLMTPVARLAMVFVRGIPIVEYQMPACCGVADRLLLERPASGGSSCQRTAADWADL